MDHSESFTRETRHIVPPYNKDRISDFHQEFHDSTNSRFLCYSFISGWFILKWNLWKLVLACHKNSLCWSLDKWSKLSCVTCTSPILKRGNTIQSWPGCKDHIPLQFLTSRLVGYFLQVLEMDKYLFCKGSSYLTLLWGIYSFFVIGLQESYTDRRKHTDESQPLCWCDGK